MDTIAHSGPCTMSADPLRISGLSRGERGLVLRWRDGSQSFFHHIWLRDCCHCSACGDCYSSNRWMVPCDIPLDVHPRGVRIDARGDLVVEWEPDGHVSRYRGRWLHENRYDDPAREDRRFRPVLWDSRTPGQPPTFDFADAGDSDGNRLALFRALRDCGCAFITHGPCRPGAVEEVASLVGGLGESAYSRIFDLTPKGSVRTAGNTTRPVPPHTDEAYRYAPPGLMVLGCVHQASEGGDTVLVDGFRIAAALKEEDPDAFSLLVRHEQNFVRMHDGKLNQQVRAPMIALDSRGEVCGVRIHTRSTGPLDLPADLVEPYYAAYHHLTRLMMAPEYQVRRALAPGDFVMFDNHRTLHARMGFADTRRHFQICNVPRETLHERLRLLAAAHGCADEARMALPAGAVR